MTTTTKPRGRRAAAPKPAEPKTELPIFALPPDLFAGAWTNLAPVTKMSDLKCWWLECHIGKGCWLVACGGPVTLAAWVPLDPGLIDAMPSLRVEPDHVLCFIDPDGRMHQLCQRLQKKYNAKDALAPSAVEYLQVRPGVKVDGKQLSLATMAMPALSFWSEGERHEVLGAEVPIVRWRDMLQTFEQSMRDSVMISSGLDVLLDIKGMRPALLEFGTGSNARVHLVPELGTYCHILGVIGIGRRPGSVEPAPDVVPMAPEHPSKPRRARGRAVAAVPDLPPDSEEPDDEAGELPALVAETFDVEAGEYGEPEPVEPEPEPSDSASIDKLRNLLGDD